MRVIIEKTRKIPCCFSQSQKRRFVGLFQYCKQKNMNSEKIIVSVFFSVIAGFLRDSIVATDTRNRKRLIFTDSKLPIPFAIIKSAHSLEKVCENISGMMKNMEKIANNGCITL